jgi:hypothetical protein
MTAAMKTKRTISLTMLSVFTALAILSPSALAASSTPLSLSMSGIITNAGNQHYVMSGGALVYGEFGGQPISASSISFSLVSQVTGLKTSGSASISAPGLSANIVISGEVPASVFPLDGSGNSCDPAVAACNSEVPFMFTGLAVVHASGQTPFDLPVAIESAYFNPFGGPIVITSLDSPTSPALLLVVTTNTATIDWIGVQVQGVVAGSYGSATVGGFYTTTTNSHEDLVNAIEQDHGQIVFSGMNVPQLDAKGTLSSTTTFSPNGGVDCSALTGIAGTCLLTGASSAGSFQMVGQQGLKISGSFATTWSVPSITTSTTASAAVTQP